MQFLTHLSSFKKSHRAAYMFITFSPYSFLYFSFYLTFLFSLLQISNFYYYWVIIEVLMLLFIGLAYSFMVSSYSQLILYFLIQTIASFLILVFYLYDLPIFLTVAFILKLSIFPFFMWYINVIYRLPNFIFWLASTLHKVPPIMILKIFIFNLDPTLLWVSIVFTTLVAGVIMLSMFDFRILLVLSSIGNNSWLLLSQISHIILFVVYMVVYRLSLFLVLRRFGGLSKLSFVKNLSFSNRNFSFWVLTLSGMPPFPLFYLKILVVFVLFYSLRVNYLFVLFLLSRAFMFIAYVRSLIGYYVFSYSTNLFYLLKY